MRYFISGHLDLTQDEFDLHYKTIIDKALEGESTFLIGDASGADSLAQKYLYGKSRHIKVYHMFDSPRNNYGEYPTMGGYTSDKDRDSAMTRLSDSDILWIRKGRESSGTAKNLKRRGVTIKLFHLKDESFWVHFKASASIIEFSVYNHIKDTGIDEYGTEETKDFYYNVAGIEFFENPHEIICEKMFYGSMVKEDALASATIEFTDGYKLWAEDISRVDKLYNDHIKEWCLNFFGVDYDSCL